MKRKGWFKNRGLRGVGSRRLVFEPLERRELLSVVIEANGSDWYGDSSTTRKGGDGGSVDVRFNWNFDGGSDKEINAQRPDLVGSTDLIAGTYHFRQVGRETIRPRSRSTERS